MTPLFCAFGFIFIVGVFAGLLALLFVIKKSVFKVNVGSESRLEEVNRFMDRFDDVENDFMAVALALYWALTVRYIITNDYPDEGGEVEPGEKPEHSGSM